jgi:hypothetical protein
MKKLLDKKKMLIEGMGLLVEDFQHLEDRMEWNIKQQDKVAKKFKKLFKSDIYEYFY